LQSGNSQSPLINAGLCPEQSNDSTGSYCSGRDRFSYRVSPNENGLGSRALQILQFAFEVKERRGVRDWVLCIVDDGALVAGEAANDPLVQDIPDARLNRTLTGQALTRAQSWVDKTDLGVVFTDGMTVRQALKAIGVALGHTSDFENSLS
jgi:hypothetical protein